LKSIKSIW